MSKRIPVVVSDEGNFVAKAEGDIIDVAISVKAGNTIVQESDGLYAASGAGDSYTKAESDARYQPEGDYALKGESYTKEESDAIFQPKGDYQAAGTSYTKAESDAKYQPVDDYALKGESYTKKESDATFQPKGDYATTTALTSGLSGKFDKTGGTITGDVTFSTDAIKSTNGEHALPDQTGTLVQAGDYGLGFSRTTTDLSAKENGFFYSDQYSSAAPTDIYFGFIMYGAARTYGFSLGARGKSIIAKPVENNVATEYSLYHTGNTTKDSNGNLKVASPVIKLFADHIETNDESEGAEMERLGVGHYLIKGVMGFNADGAWGVNNGIVIPQDHNGKNMVLVDCDVKKDGSIEMFVFHQQNADMPERFQNKRIKYVDKDGTPVYYENYEPCDVPESRWIDIRVGMPEDSIYKLKRAEAARLAKKAIVS